MDATSYENGLIIILVLYGKATL